MRRVWVTESRRRSLMAVIAAALLALGVENHAQPAKPPPVPAVASAPSASRTATAQISAISEDQSSLVLTMDRKDGTGKESQAATVSAKALQSRLRDFRAGDVVRAETTLEGTQIILREIDTAESIRVSSKGRLTALGFGAGILLILALIFLRGDIRGLLVGNDGRYSSSKFQMAMWFGVVLITYIALTWLRWWDAGGYVSDVNLPQNVLLLSGMSALTFGAAKGITTAKIQAREKKELAKGTPPAQAALVAESVVKLPATSDERRFLANLVRDDEGRADLGDFQMVVVTLLAVAAYLLQVYEYLGSVARPKVATLPDLDVTILATFGLGQGAYLTKKYASTGRE